MSASPRAARTLGLASLAGLCALAEGCGAPVATFGGPGLPSGRWMNLDLGHHRWVLALAPGERLRVQAAWPRAQGEARLHLAAVEAELDEGDTDEVDIKREFPTARQPDHTIDGTLSLVAGSNAALLELEGSGTGDGPLRLRLDRQ